MKLNKFSTSTLVCALLVTGVASQPALGQSSRHANGASIQGKSRCVVVKSAVGRNYQTAQDIWRGQGLVIGVAKDALGLGRWPVIDSNWKVLAQTPKAGKCVAKGSTIRATVKKYTD